MTKQDALGNKLREFPEAVFGGKYGQGDDIDETALADDLDAFVAEWLPDAAAE